MFHNLSWYHDLEIAHVSSTFDTDPFEPQPDAAGTIFPFWIPAPVERGAKSQMVRAKEQEAPAPGPFPHSFNPALPQSAPPAARIRLTGRPPQP